MIKHPFCKPPTTHKQQVELLRESGMVFDNSATAEFYLQHLNYYRLSAHWPLVEADHSTHRFRPNTHFDQVLNL